MSFNLLSVAGIEAKVVLPSGRTRSQTLAIVAHPWARLGGSWNDPIVRHLASTFLANGVPTVLFNTRGAGETTRTPSWTGGRERDDYREVTEAGVRAVLGKEQHGELFLCGYSHGALLALAQEPKLRSFKVYKVLVSPPLSVRWFLTPALSSTLPPVLEPEASDPIGREHALVLYGDADLFASSSTVRAWLAKTNQTSLCARAVEIEEGDHFWRKGEDALGRMHQEVRRWLEDGWTGTRQALDAGMT